MELFLTVFIVLAVFLLQFVAIGVIKLLPHSQLVPVGGRAR